MQETPVDYSTIAFFIVMFKRSAVKSQLKNAMESVTYIISSVVAVPIAVFLGDFCYASFFRPVIIERIEKTVLDSGNVDTSLTTVDRIMNHMPTSSPYNTHISPVNYHFTK